MVHFWSPESGHCFVLERVSPNSFVELSSLSVLGVPEGVHSKTAFATEIWAQNGVLNPLDMNQVALFVELSDISRVISHTDTPRTLYFTIQN